MIPTDRHHELLPVHGAVREGVDAVQAVLLAFAEPTNR
jgi:hypothetical protein